MKSTHKIFTYIPLLALLLASCTREDAVSPSADFRLKLSNDTVFAGENFTVFLSRVEGDFITLYQGDKAFNTFNPANPKAKGTVLLPGQDSMQLSYANAGKYPLTIVASSTGNWGEDYVTVVKTDTVIVNDRRADFMRVVIDKQEGKFNEDRTEIYFYTTKIADLTAKAPTFVTTSSAAQVFIGDVQQTSGSTPVDFSALTPGDPEGRPVVYTIKALHGESRSYTLKYILRDPYTEKVLNSLTISTLGMTLIPDEVNKTVEFVYTSGTAVGSLKVKASASIGATVNIGTKAIQEKEASIDMGAATKITVTAEDGSKQDYTLNKVSVETLATFSFVKAGSVDLFPSPIGVIDVAAKTITVKLLPGTPKTKLVAKFSGLTLFQAKVGSTVLTSGSTEINYSSAVTIDLYKNSKMYASYSVILE